jgi:CheY-like chemotaxis protein
VGTSFKLYFPVSAWNAEKEEPHPVSFTQSKDRRMRRERILLVEDSEQVLSVLRKILVNAQYDVVVAMNGDDAVRIFKDDQKFDLVVTDIVMPGLLQGPALSKEIRQLSPRMPFVFISGYASEATVHGNGLRPEDIRLMKPVSRATLLQAVEKALADAQETGRD